MPGRRYYRKASWADSGRPPASPKPLPNSSSFGKPLDLLTRRRDAEAVVLVELRGPGEQRTSKQFPKQLPTGGTDRSHAKPVKERVRALIWRPFPSSRPAVTEIQPCRTVFSPDLSPTSDSMSAIWDLEGRRYQQPSIPLSDPGVAVPFLPKDWDRQRRLKPEPD